MRFWESILVGLLYTYLKETSSSDTTNCTTDYFLEGSTVTLSCEGVANFIIWPGTSRNRSLTYYTLENVNRSTNGTVYQCHYPDGTQIEKTFLVARKPGSNPHITQNPLNVIADGSKKVTFTCHPGGVIYPAHCTRVSEWYFSPSNATIPCEQPEEDLSCSFHPTFEQAPEDIVCVMVNEASQEEVLAQYIPELYYPPTGKPEIEVVTPESRDSGVVRSGDQLKCSVIGGKPPPKVNFNCRASDLDDQRDIRFPNCVESRLTVKQDFDAMECTCSAQWDPNPYLYILLDSRYFKGIRTEANEDKSLSLGAIVAIVLGVLLTIKMILIAIIFDSKRRRKQSITEPPPPQSTRNSISAACAPRITAPRCSIVAIPQNLLKPCPSADLDSEVDDFCNDAESSAGDESTSDTAGDNRDDSGEG